MQKLLTFFFSKNISVYAIFNDQSFKDVLNNDILAQITRQFCTRQPSFVTSFMELHITKTYLYNFDPLKPHFDIVKLGFTGVYSIFLISAQNIDCGYSLEPPGEVGSNEYPQSRF